MVLGQLHVLVASRDQMNCDLGVEYAMTKDESIVTQLVLLLMLTVLF